MIDDNHDADVVSTIRLLKLLKKSVQNTPPQSTILLENVELVIEGNIDSDDFISNASDAIERHYNVYIYLVNNLKNNITFFL